jgi:hypothetical protein
MNQNGSQPNHAFVPRSDGTHNTASVPSMSQVWTIASAIVGALRESITALFGVERMTGLLWDDRSVRALDLSV